MSKDLQPEILTPKDLCKLLQISVVTLRRRRKEKGFPQPFSIGQQIRWRRCDVDAWLKSVSGK